MTATITRAFISLLVVGVLAGCGAAVDTAAPPADAVAAGYGANPSSASQAAMNPTVVVARTVAGVDLCGLLTTTDVTKITGLPTRMVRADPSRCSYLFGADGAGVADPTAVSITVAQSSRIAVDPAIATTFELGGNTAVQQAPRRDECMVAVFTAAWNHGADPYGQGLALTVTGFGPEGYDRCSLGKRMLTLMFSRLAR
jgi:hypothetical protein